MQDSDHFYDWQGNPHHWIDCKTKDGKRKSTIADCRREGWLPSTTTIIGKTLAKPALTQWLIKTAVEAAMTTPRLPNESIDAFVERVLAKDAQDISQQAMDLGSEIHKSIEERLAGRLIAPQFEVYVKAALAEVEKLGKVISSEKVLVSPLGYAGRTDLICEAQELLTVGDFKCVRKIPKSPWPEALLQTASYAACVGANPDWHIYTAIIYISTTNPGEVRTFIQGDWAEHFKMFKHVFELWKFLNNYDPTESKTAFAASLKIIFPATHMDKEDAAD